MTVAPTHRMLQRIRERYNRRTHGGKYEPDSRDNDIAHLLVEVDRLLAALLSSDRAVQPEADDEPLHTGDDERLDLLTQIIGDAESALDDPDPALDMGAVVNGILGDAQKLDALLVETIKRERAASSDRAVKEPDQCRKCEANLVGRVGCENCREDANPR